MKSWYHEDVSHGYPAISIFNGDKYDEYILKHESVEKIYFPERDHFYYKGFLKPLPETEEDWNKLFIDNCWVECPQNILQDFYSKLAISLLRDKDDKK